MTPGPRAPVRRPAAVLALCLVATCTPAREAAGPTPAPSRRASPVGGNIVVPVIASVSGPSTSWEKDFLEGIRFAIDEVNRGGGVGAVPLRLDLRDDGGDPGAAAIQLRESLAGSPPAVLVVGAPDTVWEARREIEAAQIPVILVGGDLYTDRRLFRFAFQASIPVRWQARVVAKYLVGDRGHRGVAVVARSGAARDALLVALGDQGISPSASGTGVPPLADAVVIAADPVRAGGLVREASALPEAPQVALTSDALHETFARVRPQAGTVTVSHYAWSGWAEPIPRVHRFRERFTSEIGHAPAGRQQEGYDAVRVLADGLEQTGGRGGLALVHAVESIRDVSYSGVPLRLGPDDHVIAEESHLGLFAVDDREPPPPEASALIAWRPLMRTFTTNGKRVNIAERDVRAFFPGWRPRLPRPNYWRSRYGIVTRPDDPLH